jgi:hypothetical protein
MATKRTSFLKRQKELKRLEKAIQKREDRMQRRLDRSDENAAPVDKDSGRETAE